MIAIIFLILGIVFFLCFVAVAIKYNIIRLIADLAGITARRTIRNMKSGSVQETNSTIVTAKITTSSMPMEQTTVLSEDSCETSILENKASSKFNLEYEIGFHDSKEIIQ